MANTSTLMFAHVRHMYGTTDRRFNLADVGEVDAMNQEIQGLIESRTEFMVWYESREGRQ